MRFRAILAMPFLAVCLLRPPPASAEAKMDLTGASGLADAAAQSQDPEASRELMGAAYREGDNQTPGVAGRFRQPGEPPPAGPGQRLDEKGLRIRNDVPTPRAGSRAAFESAARKFIPGYLSAAGGAIAGGFAAGLSSSTGVLIGGMAAGAGIGLAAFALYSKGYKKEAAGTAVGGLIGLVFGGPVGGLVGAAVGGLGTHLVGKLFG